MFTLSMQNHKGTMSQVGSHFLGSKQMAENLRLAIDAVKAFEFHKPAVFFGRKASWTLWDLWFLVFQVGSIGKNGSKMTG
jgi:hypothetical protein